MPNLGVSQAPAGTGLWSCVYNRPEFLGSTETDQNYIPMLDFGTIDSIRASGFTGFRTVAHLRDTCLKEVPDLPGVYMVLAEPYLVPKFLSVSVGGHFKGRDPTVPIAELKANWVAGAIVLNIGKAGGSGTSATLRRRISQYLRFGSGKPVGHRGGRHIWQLEGSDQLVVCWMTTLEEEPRDVEANLIASFVKTYGKRPFANLQD